MAQATAINSALRGTEPRGGYASLSKFLASDSDKALFILRRFDALAARNLLCMQDELCEIEEQIDALDKSDMDSGTPINLVSLHSRRHDRNEERVKLMHKAAEKLRVYEKALLRRSALLAVHKPLDSNIASLANWIDGEKPTIDEESHFLDLRSDLIPVSPADDQRNFLEAFLETYCQELFVTKPFAAANSKYVSSYSSTTIRRVARLLVTLAAVLAITGPTFALYFETRPIARLALIIVFSLVFATIVATTTTCKNQEMFAVVAAYAAVLIVFVGNDISRD